MGNGSWNTNTYTARAAAKSAAGQTTFDHSDQIRSGRKTASVHELLDPKWKAGDKSAFAGQIIREANISDEHPNPTAIGIVLDVTGSNYEAAIAAHSKLPTLNGLLQRKGYVEDPQIAFCAVGDAHTDRVPLQIGQFESDNRQDEQIESIYLEGNGGGQTRESYELMAYYFARHTHLDTFEKNGKKGYLFFIGDEKPYQVIKKHQVMQEIGASIEADIATKDIFEELKKRYEVFFLFQTKGAYREQDTMPEWRELLGERALMLDDPKAVAETIALTIGLIEGTVTLEDGLEDLQEVSTDMTAIKAAGKALATVGAGSTAAATASGVLPGL